MALNNHVEKFTLDMAPGGIAPVLNVSQGDTGRAYTADMYWGGASYDVSGLTVRLRGRKRDNTVFDYALPAPSGTKVSFDLKDKEQVTIIPGNVECELVFTDSDSQVVGTANFVIIVEEAPYDPNAISESEVTGLVDLISDQIGGAVDDWMETEAPTSPEFAAAMQTATDTYLDENGVQLTRGTNGVLRIGSTAATGEAGTINGFSVYDESGSANGVSKVAYDAVDMLKETVGGGSKTITTDAGNVVLGYYDINSTTNNIRRLSHDAYYTVTNPLNISSLEPGTEIVVKSSLVNNCGVYIASNEMDCLDYINGYNAESRGYRQTSEVQYITMTVPENAFYIVTTIRTVYYTDVGDFDVKGVSKNKFDELPKQFQEVVKKSTGKNKFDKNTSVNGFIEAANGSIYSPLASYNTTDFIDISSFASSVCVSPRLRMALQYDENKVPIPSSYINTATNNAVLTIADDAAYIRVSYYVEDENALQIEDGTACTTYEPFSYYVESGVNCLNDATTDALDDYIGGKARNVLFGKKWVHCGDSFSAYTNATFTSGPYVGKEKSFPRLIAERNKMNLLQEFMLSGRTLAYPADGTFTNSLTCPTNTGYYQNIPADVDYITIMLGINDMQHVGSGTTGDGEDATGAIPLGTIDDNTTATYYGAWNVVLGWLRENRPFAHIGVVVSNGMGQQLWVEANAAIAKKWGFPTIDLNGDDRTPTMIRAYNPNVPAAIKDIIKRVQAVDYDGSVTGSENTHPNWQTHEYESVFIEEWLRTL